MVSQSKKNKKKSETMVRLVSAPISQGVVFKQRGPRQQVRHTATGIEVSAVEKLTNVGTSSTAGAFASSIFGVIPTFPPWLSGLAICYSRYRWESLEIIYIPQCPTTTSGVAVEAFLYDSNDTGFVSVGASSSIQGAVVHPLWAGSEGAMSLHATSNHPGCISAKCDLTDVREFMPVVSGTTFAALSTADKVNYCKTYLLTATEGSSSVSTTVGGLYIKYRISLRDPVPIVANN